MRDPDRKLGRLLAGKNEPSVLEREAAFDEVARQASGSEKKTGWLFGLSMALGTAAAVFMAFLALPQKGDDPFSPRGDLKASFRTYCVQESKTVPCRIGGKMVVEVTAPAPRPHFAVVGFRPDDAVVWYLPARDGKSMKVEASKPQLLEEGFVLAAETHIVGEMTLRGVFSAEPLDRDGVKAALLMKASGDVLEIVDRKLNVEVSKP